MAQNWEKTGSRNMRDKGCTRTGPLIIVGGGESDSSGRQQVGYGKVYTHHV